MNSLLATIKSIACFTETRDPARDEVLAFVSINWASTYRVRVTVRDRAAKHVQIEMSTFELAQMVREANTFFARNPNALAKSPGVLG